MRTQSVNPATDLALTLIQMDGSMSANSKMVVFMGEASIPGRMDVFTLANSKMAKEMVREP